MSRMRRKPLVGDSIISGSAAELSDQRRFVQGPRGPSQHREPSHPSGPATVSAHPGHRTERWIVGGCLMLVAGAGAAILFGHVGHQSIWIDEAHVFRYCRRCLSAGFPRWLPGRQRRSVANRVPAPDQGD